MSSRRFRHKAFPQKETPSQQQPKGTVVSKRYLWIAITVSVIISMASLGTALAQTMQIETFYGVGGGIPDFGAITVHDVSWIDDDELQFKVSSADSGVSFDITVVQGTVSESLVAQTTNVTATEPTYHVVPSLKILEPFFFKITKP